jgi:hypothetical protein
MLLTSFIIIFSTWTSHGRIFCSLVSSGLFNDIASICLNQANPLTLCCLLLFLFINLILIFLFLVLYKFLENVRLLILLPLLMRQLRLILFRIIGDSYLSYRLLHSFLLSFHSLHGNLLTLNSLSVSIFFVLWILWIKLRGFCWCVARSTCWCWIFCHSCSYSRDNRRLLSHFISNFWCGTTADRWTRHNWLSLLIILLIKLLDYSAFNIAKMIML